MNKLKNLNKRERLLAAVVLAVVILGVYGLLRFEPKLDDTNKLALQMESTLNRLAKMDIPTEPEEGVDDIKRALDDQEKALEAINQSARQIETQLAPLDSQELKVRISELARDSGIRIRINENLKPTAIKIEKIQKGKRGQVTPEPKEIIPPPTAGWITRLSPGSMFERPLQRIEVDGNYLSLRRFVHGLDEMPYQVTVVRMNIDKLPLQPLRGMSQLLKAELVLAL